MFHPMVAGVMIPGMGLFGLGMAGYVDKNPSHKPEDRKIALALDAKARLWLAEKGYDPTYGARPLKRVIQKWVQDPLAQMLLAGDIRDGGSVKLSVSHGRLTVNGKEVGGEPEDSPQPKSPSVVPFPKT